MKHVGMIVLVRIPTDNCPLAAVCFKRSGYNTEDPRGLKKQNFANALQVTWHGKGEDDESDCSILYREGREEIGKEATEMVIGNAKLVESSTKENGDRRATYAVLAPIKFLDYIRTGIASAGVEFITHFKTVMIRPLKDQDKDGVESGKLRMFSDEFRAIKKAFEIFA